MKILTRKEALATGAVRYFTGIPCMHGHLCERQTTNKRCVECARLQAKKARDTDPSRHRIAASSYRAKNQDKVRSIRKAYYEKNKEIAKAATRAYYAKNREAILNRAKNYATVNASRIKEYLAANRDKSAARSLRWAKRNQDCRNAIERNRRSRKKKSEGSHTKDDISAIRKEQKDKCAYCRIKLGGKGHVDHIKPLSLGGSNGRRNLQLLCQPCNQRKHAKDPIKFAQELGLIV